MANFRSQIAYVLHFGSRNLHVPKRQLHTTNTKSTISLYNCSNRAEGTITALYFADEGQALAPRSPRLPIARNPALAPTRVETRARHGSWKAQSSDRAKLNTPRSSYGQERGRMQPSGCLARPHKLNLMQISPSRVLINVRSGIGRTRVALP